MFDGVEQGAEECERRAGGDLTEGEAGSGPVVEQAEHGARSAGIGEEGQVHCPQEVARDAPWPAVFELAPEAEDLLGAALEHIGDEGLADGFAAAAMDEVEDVGDLAAAVIGQERLEAQHFPPHPGGFRGSEGGAGWRERGAGAAARGHSAGGRRRSHSRTQTAATRRPETIASSKPASSPPYEPPAGAAGRYRDSVWAAGVSLVALALIRAAPATRRLALLGKDSDRRLARPWGVSNSSVAARRRLLGIPPFRPPALPVRWTARTRKLLGRLPDAEVARRLAIGVKTVIRERRRLGIRPARKERRKVLSSPALRRLLARPTVEVVARTGLSSSAVFNLRRRL